ncbi:MAG: periplasmic heavy metal sensor [Aestuariivirga sp.]
MSNFVSSIPPFTGGSEKSQLFWRTLLLISLMFNLLVAGILIGQFHFHGQGAKFMGPAYVQYVPGRFFAELPKERRHELAETLRANRQDFQKLRGQSAENAQKLAEALEQENYDPTRVNTLIDTFTTGPESLAAGGGKVLKDFYAVLTPTERKDLAQAIHEAPKRMHSDEHGWWHSRLWN